MEKTRNIKQKIETVFDVIRTLVTARFYGKVTLSFENGNIVHVKEEKTWKP